MSRYDAKPARTAYDEGYRDGASATRLAKLEREMRAIRQIASNAREAGITGGAVLWREALEKIINLSDDGQESR